MSGPLTYLAAFLCGGALCLIGQIQNTEDTLCGAFDVLDVAQAEGNILQRVRKLTGEQDDGYNGSDRHPLAQDQPAADDGHGNISQGIDKGNDRLDDRREKITEDAAALMPL